MSSFILYNIMQFYTKVGLIIDQPTKLENIINYNKIRVMGGLSLQFNLKVLRKGTLSGKDQGQKY